MNYNFRNKNPVIQAMKYKNELNKLIEKENKMMLLNEVLYRIRGDCIEYIG